MKKKRLTVLRFRRRCFWTAAFHVLSFGLAPLCVAQTGALAEPFPAPAPNAALHYQRALLLLANLDETRTKPLSIPILEALPAPAEKALPPEVGSLLYRARFVVQSAASGSRTAACNFGIDFSAQGAAIGIQRIDEHPRQQTTLRRVGVSMSP